MKAIAVENILAEVLQMEPSVNVTIHTKSGADYTFNVYDNDDIIPESVEKDGILQVFCNGEGTAWIDIDSIESFKI